MAAGFRPAESTSPRSYIEARAPTEERPASEVRADATFAYAQDFALAQRAAEGDARAERQIAQRLIARVRRAAHALQGGALEADDAALHALIELLRAVRAYPGETSLEKWADRLVARSLVRFARAVRTRQASAAAAGAADPLTARTLDEFLRALPSAEREALVLRETFGFDLVETAQVVRTSTRVLCERLARARRGLYLRTLDEREASAEPPLAAVERWFALRDRRHATSPRTLDPETGVGNDALNDEEQDELRALEAQPAMHRLQKKLKTLAHLVESGGSSKRDKKLMARALAAVHVSSDYGPRTAVEAAMAAQRARVRELSEEPTDDSWVRPISTGLCVVLVVAAFVALALRPTQLAVRSQPSATPRPGARRTPTVQAMSSAQPVARGARLSRSGEPLTEGMNLREDDVVSAGSDAGCFGLSPRADVCLAANSEARIAQLGLPARRVELVRGRAVVSVERVEPAAPFTLSVGDLRIEASDAAFGLELGGDQTVVRVLRGTALVATPGGTHALTTAQSGVYRAQRGQLEIAPQAAERARRDWELLSERGLGRLLKSTRTSTKVSAPAEELPARPSHAGPDEIPYAAVPPPVSEEPPALRTPEQAAVPTGPLAASTPEKSLAKANELASAGRHADAAALCLMLIAAAPDSASAREALVLRAELLAERLGHARQALGYFERYLRSGGGPHEVRARYGRILALRRLGRTVEERAATQEFLFSHADAPQAQTLKTAVEWRADAPARGGAQSSSLRPPSKPARNRK